MQPRKILAVDDSKLMLKMYEVMLRQHPIAFAEDGLEAVRQLEQDGEIDLVILDINMPRMGGLEVLAALKERGLLQRVRVVIVTTEGEQDQVQRGLQAGASGYLTKPVDREQLLQVMASMPAGGVM